MSRQRKKWLSPELSAWLSANAASLNDSNALAAEVLPRLSAAGLNRIAVPEALGGVGGARHEAVQAIAEVAEHSLTAAFVLWAQRAFIDYLCVTDSPAVRERWLASSLNGEVAGATGLSNAMKFLSQLEPLQVKEQLSDGQRSVGGRLFWVTNLRAPAFAVAAAVQPAAEDRQPLIVILDSADRGLARSEDLDLLALRASNTAALELEQVAVPDENLLSSNGCDFLKRARPMFLSLQCGMSLGLARSALTAAGQGGPARDVLRPRIEQAWQTLQALEDALSSGLDAGCFEADAPALFRIRLNLAAVVQEAIQLELQGSGGRAYLRNHLPDFGRRLQESAFVPVVTPSLVQLQAELNRQSAGSAVGTAVVATAADSQLQAVV